MVSFTLSLRTSHAAEALLPDLGETFSLIVTVEDDACDDVTFTGPVGL
jgi:hypothetical protein